MRRRFRSEDAKERASRARRHAKRYTEDAEYRARMQENALKRYAEIRVDPERFAKLKKERRKYRRTTGKFLHELSQQRAYHKMAANPEWRETTREIPQ